MFKLSSYFQVVKLAYRKIIRPWLVKQTPRTSNKIDDELVSVIDKALEIEEFYHMTNKL